MMQNADSLPASYKLYGYLTNEKLSITSTKNCTMQNVAQKIKQLMIDKLDVEENQLNNNTTFKDDLNVDSLDVLELQIELEKEFRIIIPDEDAEKLLTVGSVLNYISNRIK